MNGMFEASVSPIDAYASISNIMKGDDAVFTSTNSRHFGRLWIEIEKSNNLVCPHARIEIFSTRTKPIYTQDLGFHCVKL